MNKKHLTWAVLYGAMLGFVMFNAMSPRPESFVLSPDLEGNYPELIEEDDFRVETNEFGNGSLRITFEPATPMIHYVVGLMIALSLGAQYYRSLEEAAKKKEEEDGFSPSLNHPPSIDPLYEEFLQEDTNRCLFPRAHLEEEFEEWQVNQATPKE